MPDTRTINLTLSTGDAATVAAMAAALALPVEEFLGGVVAAWVAKPKNYRRFAKRLLGSGDDRRERMKAVARSLERARREPAPKRTKATKAKPKPRRAAKSAASQAKRSATAPMLAIAASG